MIFFTHKKLRHDLTNIIAALTTVSRRMISPDNERLAIILNDAIAKLTEIVHEADASNNASGNP